MHKILFYNKFISCLCMFRGHVLTIRRSKLCYTASGIITPYRWPSGARDGHLQRCASHYIFLFKYHVLLHILRILFFSSDDIMADVTSKQQTTALFFSTIVTRTRRRTELTKELTNLMGNLCCAREHSVSLSCSFVHS